MVGNGFSNPSINDPTWPKFENLPDGPLCLECGCPKKPHRYERSAGSELWQFSDWRCVKSEFEHRVIKLEREVEQLKSVLNL